MSDYDPTDLATIPEPDDHAVDQALAVLAERDQVVWLMSEKIGRRIVWRLLEKTGVYRSSFQGDVHAMVFREGERNVGLWLLALINTHCAGQYALMLQEMGEHV